MGKPIVHHEGLFFEWSDTVDGPTSCVMTRPEFEAYYRERHGTEGMKDLGARLDRAVENGSSAFEGLTAEECIVCNAFGENGEKVTVAEMVEQLKEARDVYGLPPLPEAGTAG